LKINRSTFFSTNFFCPVTTASVNVTFSFFGTKITPKSAFLVTCSVTECNVTPASSILKVYEPSSKTTEKCPFSSVEISSTILSFFQKPIININDKDFNFRYLEFEQLVFDQNSFNSNLTSVLAFYANIIIGLEMDSLSELGGSKYLDSAANIMNVAQSSGFKGWTQAEGNNTNRFFLITDILSNTFTPYRKALYEYHFKGLDIMSEDIQKAKENLISAITTLSDIHKVRPNSFLMRTFFDAKTDEIVSVFSGGPRVDVVSLNETLNRISPLNSVNWNKIR
jgi:hypothetical protein